MGHIYESVVVLCLPPAPETTHQQTETEDIPHIPGGQSSSSDRQAGLRVLAHRYRSIHGVAQNHI